MGIQFLGFDFHIDFEALTLISQDIREVLETFALWGSLLAAIKLLYDGLAKLLKIYNETKRKENKTDNTTETAENKK
ncbi:MAG: hypothetical protein KH231_06025 [Dialister sp.]|uniref:hypothetical protein n=1 Tax=Dialister sp. TaxID=1955814 RepID=UPI001DCFCB1F|nr:hypothetical protein [Dialister sp.]MBS6715014.1 hypothetical protein [Dialister sp.]